jgi:UDP-glucose 4-epimerase
MPMTEDHPQVPISPYGRTKLAMEHMMQDYARAYGFRAAALRYFNAAGASPDGAIGESHDPETHLIPLVLKVAAGERDAITVFGDDYDTPDGTCIRDYVHVDDLAEAHLAALAKLQAGMPSIAVNLGTGQGYSVREVVDVARRVTGREIAARVAGRRAGDPPRLICGGTRARELLGWVPARGELEVIVRDAWNFHRRHPRGL